MLNSCLFHRNGFSWLKMNKNSVDCQATAGKLIKPVRLRERLCENNPDEENTFFKKKTLVCVEVMKCHFAFIVWTKTSPQG